MPEALDTLDPIETHPFISFVRANARMGNLREQFVNYVNKGPEALPRDNEECAKLIRRALEVYTESNKPKDDQNG